MNVLTTYYRCGLRAIMTLFAVLAVQFVAPECKAAFPIRADHPAPAYTTPHPSVSGNHNHHPLRYLRDATTGNDGYKGILAIVAGGAGMGALLVALITATIGGVFAAFFLGLAGIVFGALPKKANRGLGRAGLIMGIVDVVLVLLFIVVVAIALASFT